MQGKSMIVSHDAPKGSQISVPRILLILWERKFIVLFCTFVGLAVAVAHYVRTRPRYTAEATLALDVRKLQALPIESVVSPLPQESPVLRTELDIIGSQVMAERVLAQLKKQADTDATKVLTSPESIAFFAPTPNTEIALAEREAMDRNLTRTLMSNVRVVNDGRSYTIYISFTADDPMLAAMVANAYGESYIDYQIDLQTSGTRRVSDWLGERLVSLRSKLEESESLAATFKENAGIVKSDGTTLQSQEIAGLSAELTSLKAKMAASSAQLATAVEAQRNGKELDLAEVLVSPIVQQLRVEEARVVRAIGELDDSGALKSSQLPQLKSQLESLKSQISREVTRIVDSKRAEIQTEERQLASIEESLKTTRDSMAENSQLVVHADQLDREASANRTIYESYLARYKQTIEQEGIESAEARMISEAVPSGRPASPNLVFGVLAGVLFGAMGGVAAAGIFYLIDRRVGSVEMFEAKTGLSVIGKIPALSPKQKSDCVRLLHNPQSPFGHAMSEVQSQLRLFANAETPRVISIASIADGDGKSYIVASLARLAAAAGMRTLVVEANMRDPTLAEQFGIRSRSDLQQIVAKNISFEKLIHHDPGSMVDLIPAERSSTPEAVLASRSFSLILDDAKRSYDIILIDTPSSSYGLDLVRITSLSDLVLFVVRPGKTVFKELQALIKRLKAANRTIGGVIFNFSMESGRPARRSKLGNIGKALSRTKSTTPAPRTVAGGVLSGE
jgi:uncharacterized protein involved in exopolysaccharide biosynthesis/Mrp family chromosome partitioning ATPase